MMTSLVIASLAMQDTFGCGTHCHGAGLPSDFNGLYHGSMSPYHWRLTSPSGRGNMQYLWTPTVDGRPYAYYRRARRVIRIRASDGTPLLPSEPGFQAA